MNRMADKVTIVTGAGSGIGRAIAERLAAEGSTVVVADFAPEGGQETVDLITASGGVASFQQVDVTKFADVERMVAATVASYGKVSALVNNAGISAGDQLRIHEVTEEVWDRIMNVNMKGVFNCCKAVLPVMMEQGGGSVVNIASAAAITMGPRAAYAASKGGVLSFTRSIALQYGEYRIRANAICPGPIDTPMSRAARSNGLYASSGIVDSAAGRRGDPIDIANAVLFLASDESKFVTADALVVDGGAMRLRAEQFRGR